MSKDFPNGISKIEFVFSCWRTFSEENTLFPCSGSLARGDVDKQWCCPEDTFASTEGEEQETRELSTTALNLTSSLLLLHSSFRETCLSGRCIDALRRDGGFLRRGGEGGWVLEKVCLVRGTGGGPLLWKGGWLLEKRGRVPKNRGEGS